MSDLASRWPSLRMAWRQIVGAASVHDGPFSRDEQARAAQGIARLSERLTRQRDRLSERYLDDPELRAAYLVFYWPVSYAQARAVFGELRAPLGRVLDLGAGPLPMSWAAHDAGATTVRALERVAAARELGRSLGDGVEVAAWDAGQPLPDGAWDTVVAGHLLNELEGTLARRTAIVSAWCSRLAPGGRLVLVEPALRESSRQLLEVRDALVAAGVQVLAPCLRQAHCPALARESDWCHAEREWAAPDELHALAEAARIHKDRLKWSYLVLSRDPAPRYDETLYRVVSEPLDEKGKYARIGCGPYGRVRLVLRTRDRSPRTEALAGASRGDVLRVEGVVPRGDGQHLASDGSVELVAPVGAPAPER